MTMETKNPAGICFDVNSKEHTKDNNDSDDRDLIEQAKAEIALEKEEHSKDDHSMNKSGGSEYDRLNREKRLAMNRVSARERRKRKRLLVETLERTVAELTKKNEDLRETNDKLRGDIDRLTADLLGSSAGNTGAVLPAATTPLVATAPATAAGAGSFLGSVPGPASLISATQGASTAIPFGTVSSVQPTNLTGSIPSSAATSRQQQLLQQLQLNAQINSRAIGLSSLGYGVATDPYASLLENQIMDGAGSESLASRYLQQLQK